MSDPDRTASLMSPAKLAQLKRAQPAASPAVWLDQMAADVGRLPVEHLAEVVRGLQSNALERNYTPVAGQLQELSAALKRLDFDLLKSQGWLARTMGKERSSGAQFAEQVEQVLPVGQALSEQSAKLHKVLQAGSGAAERALVEMEVERGALDQTVDQGNKWLQDMRTQLQQRHAQALDAARQQQVKEDAARCEILVERLKGLRAVGKAAQQSHKQAQSVAAGRTALLHTLQQTLPAAIKSWQARLGSLAAAANSGGAAPNVDGPKDTHQELRQQTKRAAAACAHLQGQEEALGQSLQALSQQLAAVGPG